jgi:hypothetical protein
MACDDPCQEPTALLQAINAASYLCNYGTVSFGSSISMAIDVPCPPVYVSMSMLDACIHLIRLV